MDRKRKWKLIRNFSIITVVLTSLFWGTCLFISDVFMNDWAKQALDYSIINRVFDISFILFYTMMMVAIFCSKEYYENKEQERYYLINGMVIGGILLTILYFFTSIPYITHIFYGPLIVGIALGILVSVFFYKDYFTDMAAGIALINTAVLGVVKGVLHGLLGSLGLFLGFCATALGIFLVYLIIRYGFLPLIRWILSGDTWWRFINFIFARSKKEPILPESEPEEEASEAKAEEVPRSEQKTKPEVPEEKIEPGDEDELPKWDSKWNFKELADHVGISKAVMILEKNLDNDQLVESIWPRKWVYILIETVDNSLLEKLAVTKIKTGPSPF